MTDLGNRLGTAIPTKGGPKKGAHMLFKSKREARSWEPPRCGRAVIYLRGLDNGQTGLINAPSIDVQRQFCQRMANDLDAEVVGEFVDLAGTPLPRPGMERLLERLNKRPAVDYLIVYSLDRLAPEREGAFIVGWHLGSTHTTLVSWARAYESEIKQQKIAD